MAFNIVARNQDDHVKNIAFLMDRAGRWSLSPAFDVTYSYNPAGRWTGAHQMTLNGKQDDFEVDDFVTCARNAALKRGRATAILRDVERAVSRWREFAKKRECRLKRPAGLAPPIVRTCFRKMRIESRRPLAKRSAAVIPDRRERRPVTSAPAVRRRCLRDHYRDVITLAATETTQVASSSACSACSRVYSSVGMKSIAP